MKKLPGMLPTGILKNKKKNCPHERATNRHAVAEIIRQMEALSPHVKGNLFAAMKNIQSEYLP